MKHSCFIIIVFSSLSKSFGADESPQTLTHHRSLENWKLSQVFCDNLGTLSPPLDSTCWESNTVDEYGKQKGCDYTPCAKAVCKCDPYCCNQSWDLSCRGYSNDPTKPKDNPITPGCAASKLCCEDAIFFDMPSKRSLDMFSKKSSDMPSKKSLDKPFNEIRGSRVICPSDQNTIGYADIDSLKNDMIQDSLQYENGTGGGFEPVYVLCPNTDFDLTRKSAIAPMLDNTIIKCGSDGSSTNECVINGGEIHFEFPPYICIRNVVVKGITMTGSTDISVCAWGWPSSSVSFVDCHWKYNEGDCIIDVWWEEDFNKRRKLMTESTMDRFRHAGRKIQSSSGMVAALERCTFTENNENIGIIVTADASAQLTDCKLVQNISDGVTIGIANGGKVTVDASSTFENNISAFATIYASPESSLEISDETKGVGNIAGVCSIFYESEGSTCQTNAYDPQSCFGECCEFGEIGCFL